MATGAFDVVEVDADDFEAQAPARRVNPVSGKIRPRARK
jgi:hypothetical protein